MPKQKGASDGGNHIRCFRQYLRPMLLSLKIVGLYFDADHFPKTSHHFSNEYGLHSITLTDKRKHKIRADNNIAVSEDDMDVMSISTGCTPVHSIDSNLASNENGHDNGDQLTKSDFVTIMMKRESGFDDDEEIINLLVTNGISQKKEFDRDKPSSEFPQSPKNAALSCLRAVFRGRIYALLVMIALWLNCFRCIIYVGDEQVSWVILTSTISWYLMCALNATTSFVSCWKKSHFNTFFINWTLLYKLAEDEFSLGMNKVTYITGIKSTVVIVLSTAISFYAFWAWYSTIFFIVLICMALVGHFKHFRDILKAQIIAAGNKIPTHFAELRERHLVMCNLTSIFDKYASLSLAAIVCVEVATACLFLYFIIKEDLPPKLLGILCSAIVSGIGSVGALIYYAAKVHDEMHSVQHELQAIQTTNATQDQCMQLQLFLSKVNGPDLGLSLLGLITIKKEFLLTLFGLYVTYVIVLLQFN